MRSPALRALGLCLGVMLYLGAIAALPGTASALEVPTSVIDDLGKAAEDFHPPQLYFPRVDEPPKVAEFGAADATTIEALEADQASENAVVSKKAEEFSSDGEERDRVEECAEKGLLAILEEGGKGLTYEEAAEKGLAPCFDELVPEGEQVRTVLEYFRKQEAEQSSEAYADAGNNPTVLGNWLRSTAASVHPAAEPSQEQPSEPPGATTSSGGEHGVSAGVIAVIIVVVGGVLFLVYRGSQRKGRS
jgi:hypothetical protein